MSKKRPGTTATITTDIDVVTVSAQDAQGSCLTAWVHPDSNDLQVMITARGDQTVWLTRVDMLAFLHAIDELHDQAQL